MPRYLSFAVTEQAFLDGSMDVTRRLGWRFLRREEILCAVRKSMGLRSGETVVRLGYIKVIDVRVEPLDDLLRMPDYGWAECRREGFPAMTPGELLRQFQTMHDGCREGIPVTRIVFRHVPDRPNLPPTLWGGR